MMEMYTRKEPLCAELEKYHYKAKTMDMVRHPLVYSVPYHPSENAMLNYRLKLLKEAVAAKLLESDFAGFVFLHEKPYRLDAFMSISDKLTPYQYWELLGEVWVNSENIWQNKSHWDDLLKAKISDKHAFMSIEDQKEFSKLPSSFVAFRGCTNLNENGYSYTLDKDIAERFSRWSMRDKSKGIVITREVKKKDVFAFTNSRGEKEVIILPK